MVNKGGCDIGRKGERKGGCKTGKSNARVAARGRVASSVVSSVFRRAAVARRRPAVRKLATTTVQGAIAKAMARTRSLAKKAPAAAKPARMTMAQWRLLRSGKK